jgi:adenylate cyclase class IV
MNDLFDTPHATLRKRGQLLRLRTETPLGGSPWEPRKKLKARGEPRYVLTFKGPGQSDKMQTAPAGSRRYGRYKVRAETEFILPEPRGFMALMEQSGMRRTFRYEKIRTSYRMPGARGAHLELDETPCGVFLELEGPRRAIDRLASRLGYRPKDYITASYAALHFDACRRRGLPGGDMVFRPRNPLPA